MNPPKQIRIFNRLWSVKFIDDSVPDSRNAWGWCEPATQTIFIFRNQKPDCLADTFLHEIIHAIYDSLGMNQNEEENTIHRLDTLRQHRPRDLRAVVNCVQGMA
jgi:hypothetical protein